MRKLALTAGLLMVVSLLLIRGLWRGAPRADAGAPAEARKVLYYVDPMNPAHTADKPGKAPCGMDMEPVYAEATLTAESAATPASLPVGTVRVSPEKQQLIGVRVASVQRAPLHHQLRLLGRVAVDETRTYRINAAVSGWVTKALPYTTGSYVKKDETLASFYSPEFLAAMQALLFGINARDRTVAAAAAQDNSLATMHSNQLNQANLGLQQYRDTLLNMGMGNGQIDDIIRSRKYKKEIDVTSPAAGFILVRNVSEGLRFEKGNELFRIADLSRIWVLVDVFTTESRFIRPGAEVRVSAPDLEKKLKAVVSQSLPQFDGISRTLKLRLELDNPEYELKPDMFVDVELPVELPEAVVVPAEAVLDSGLRQVVFVERAAGLFEPRNVHLGRRAGDQVQVLQGLELSERIVVSGNFLLDSESRMKLSAAGLQGASAPDPVCGMMVEEVGARVAKRMSEYGGKTYSFCSDGCKKKFDADPLKYLAKAKSPTMAMVTAEPKQTADPVCGMKVDVEEAKTAKLTSEHQGKMYFFCNATCKKKFGEAPEKYLAASKP
jgi:membrane fusion protein, copper/silver efflux system